MSSSRKASSCSSTSSPMYGMLWRKVSSSTLERKKKRPLQLNTYKPKVWSAHIISIHITRLISYHEVVLQRRPGVHERDSCHCWQWSHGNGLSFKRWEAELNGTHLKEKQSGLSFDNFYPYCMTTIFRTVSHARGAQFAWIHKKLYKE